MTSYHERLESQFHEIVDLEPAARDDRLRALRERDPELATELERMLAHDVTGHRGPAADGDMPHGPGSLIGAYRLLRVLGAGGMGVVWEAEQSEPVRRRVALKLLPSHRSSESLRRRFDAERQALASLDHPNITSLLDSGTTASDEPWFAMELIDGQPITDFCDRHAVPLSDRLELFESLCDAIQHAHQRGLIHRDLKPSNVIVAASETTAPRLRVIDFGIVKSLPEAIETTRAQTTLAGDIVGTPEYMSPEQAGYEDGIVDTRTDVYALGVILYELLVGELPISAGALRRAGVDEMRRVIREEDAPKPSSRLTTGAVDKTTDVARHRATRPAELLRRVRGELDWIVLKAIAKSKAERYETPRALAADLRRFVDGDPVHAGPPSWRYRVGKWMRKHRVATLVVTGAVLLISLSVALIAAALLRAQAAERAALREVEQERATRAFLVELFEASDPFERDPWTGVESSPRQITSDEMLDRGARRLLDGSIEDPVTRARLQVTVGELYLQLADDEAAAELIEQALASLEASGGGADATDERARALLAAGDLSIARAEHEAALDHFRRALAAAHSEALALRARARAGTAEALRLAAGDGDAVDEALAAVELASRAVEHDEGAEAERVLEHSLAVLAAAQTASGAAADAVGTYGSLIERQERAWGPDHPRLSISYRGLSNALEVAGRYEEGGEVAEKALRISRGVLGDEHPVVAYDLANVAASHRMRGQYAEAVALLREAEATLRTTRPHSLALADTLAQIGMCLEELGQPDLAVAVHRESASIYEQVHGSEHPDLGPALSRLSSALRAAGRAAEALPISRKAVRLAEAAHPQGHWQVVVTLAELTQALIGAGELDAAVERAEDMVATARRLMGEDHVMHAAVQTIRAEALIRSALERRSVDQLDQAAEAINLSRTIFEQQQGAQSPNLGQVAELQRMLSDAEAELDDG